MKNKLREIAKEKRYNIDATILNSKIENNFVKLNELKLAKNILTYYSFNNEVSTLFCFNNKNKTWYLPRIQGLDLEICPYNEGELEYNNFKLLQPTNKAIESTSIIDMVIIPCIAADRNGYRLGYGKGYYDRFLPRLNKETIKVIFCYSDLIFESVFPEKHDIRADIIVTDKEIYRINC